MYQLKVSLEELGQAVNLCQTKLFPQGFEVTHHPLKEFFQILLNPLNGAHTTGSRQSLVSVVTNNKMVDYTAWSHSFPGDEGCYRDISAIKKSIQLKFSIIFDQYYRYSQAARDLLVVMESYFKCSSGCNVYLSQQGGKAFSIHRDEHHVLIFSLSGKKRWKVYNAQQPMYLAHEGIPALFTEQTVTDSGLSIDSVLTPGDLLYIPIGQFHSVENLTDNALHLTVSLRFKPILSLLRDFFDFLHSNELANTLPKNIVSKLNTTHPIHRTTRTISSEHISTMVEELCDILKEIACTEEFVKLQNQIDGNKHLKVFSTPTDELVEDFISCSTSN